MPNVPDSRREQDFDRAVASHLIAREAASPARRAHVAALLGEAELASILAHAPSNEELAALIDGSSLSDAEIRALLIDVDQNPD